MTSKMIITKVAVALAVFLTLTACRSTPSPTLPALNSAPALSGAEAVNVARAYFGSLAGKPDCVGNGEYTTTASYTDGKWVVKFPYCSYVVDDTTGVVTSR